MRSPITTHVLDTARGCPAAGLRITLARLAGATWEPIADAATDEDGRVADLMAPGSLTAGTYKMVFHTGPWLAAQGRAGFYPRVPVIFEISAPDEHYHVPLLLSPFGYSTYRGS